ncbi:MAG: hypothetical protein KDK78_09280, partial [Chlamydiia bacterium]|nr:hypothetical protein [Chlamydiia bacterium]
MALTAIQAAKQFSFGDLLGSYRSPELGEDKEKIRFSPRYIEACTRQGRVASSVGTALAVGGSGAVSIVGALLLLTSAGPLGLGLFAGGLLGMGVLGFPATIVPLGWMYGKRDQEL